MKKIFYIILVLMLALFISGCSNGETDANDENGNGSLTGIIEPEQLISQETAQTLVGNDLQEGEKLIQEVVGQRIIFYSPIDDDILSDHYFQIAITQQAFMPTDSLNTPTSLYESIKMIFNEDGTVEEVEGIGDTAMFVTPGLHILSDGYYLVVSAGNSDDEQIREILKDAGALAVENLEEILNQ